MRKLVNYGPRYKNINETIIDGVEFELIKEKMKLTKILAIIDDVILRSTFPTIAEYGQKIKKEVIREAIEEVMVGG